MTIVAAADGSALGNPGPAGWAWYVDEGHWASGGWPHGTNNMGELTAVLRLLEATAHLDEDLLVYCDSMYAINTITKWMAGWKRKGWRKRDGKPVMNVDIVRALDAAMTGRRVRLEWVKGHAGHPLNEAADRLANAAALAYKGGSGADAGPGYGGHGAAGSMTSADELPDDLPEADFLDLFADLDAELDSVDAPPGALAHVVGLERSLLTGEIRGDPASVAALLHPAWVEVDASGRLWSRAEFLAVVGPIPGGCDLEVLAAREVTSGVVLLLWRSSADDGTAIRTSLWLREGGNWRQVHHHVTSDADPT